MRWSGMLLVSVIAVGCTTAEEDTKSANQGIAEIRVDAVLPGVTRVTVDAAGNSQDLKPNPSTGGFDGTLLLPRGTQNLVARAFAQDVLVGESRSTPVEVAPAETRRVLLRILDLRSPGAQTFGPIIDFLSYPATTDAGTAVSLAVAAVAPMNKPLTYDWSSDCADATFDAPHAAQTAWSKPTEGRCAISVVVTADGVPVATSFSILVFPAGSTTGGVAVSTIFVTPPVVSLNLGEAFCGVTTGSNASCLRPIDPSEVVHYQLQVFDWGGLVGSIALSDDCGGRFETGTQGPSFVTGTWLPPNQTQICTVTARGVNGEGVATQFVAAILVRPRVARPPVITAELDNGCQLTDVSAPADCGELGAGGTMSLLGSVDWRGAVPLAVTIADCSAGIFVSPDEPLARSWTVVGIVGIDCQVTVEARNRDGDTVTLAGRYRTVASP